MAQQERAFIREQIAAGKDKAQIKAALVDEYGEEVLAEPEARRLQRDAVDRADRARRCSPRAGSASRSGAGARNAGETPIETELPPPLSAEDARRLDAELEPMTGGVDTTVIAAFAVGFVSFISPCVLPLVPGYLSAVSGVSLAEMKSGERSLPKILLPAIVFCLSFTAVFVALGHDRDRPRLDAAELQRGTLDKIAGAVIVALGVFFLLTPFVPRLNRNGARTR